MWNKILIQWFSFDVTTKSPIFHLFMMLFLSGNYFCHLKILSWKNWIFIRWRWWFSRAPKIKVDIKSNSQQVGYFWQTIIMGKVFPLTCIRKYQFPKYFVYNTHNFLSYLLTNCIKYVKLFDTTHFFNKGKVLLINSKVSPTDL